MNPTEYGWQPVSSVLQDLPAPYTEVDAQGILRVVNEAACLLHDMTAEEMIGHSVWEFVPRDEAARDRAEFMHVIETGDDPPVIRRSLYTSRGEYRVHEIHRRMMRDSDGTPLGLCCVFFDVTEMDAALGEAKQARMWVESALAAIPQAVIVTDALGFVRSINRAAERLTGWSSRELLGLQIEKGMPILRATSKSQKPLSFRMTLDEPWNGDVEILNRERQTVAVWLSASPIADMESGYTNGVVIVLGSPKIVERSGPAARNGT
jgi:PAS domain S-box-containing protein